MKTGSINREFDNYTKGYPPDWNARKNYVHERDSYRCQSCGAKKLPENDVELDCDHITPKSDGGSHNPSNLQTLCLSCHSSKHPYSMKLKYRKTPWLFKAVKKLTSYFKDSNHGEGSKIKIDEIKKHQDRVSIQGLVSEVWKENDGKIEQMGLLSDDSGGVKFVSWRDNDVRRLKQDARYRFDFLKVDTYKGSLQVIPDKYTEITYKR